MRILLATNGDFGVWVKNKIIIILFIPDANLTSIIQRRLVSQLIVAEKDYRPKHMFVFCRK